MSKELVKTTTKLDELARLGTWLAMSESGDNSANAKGATAALRLYYATELGLSPMAAAELSMIKGRLYVGAQLLRALAIKHGYRVFRVEVNDKACTARLVRSDGQVLGESTFTLEQARKAGLIRNGSPWETHPSRMLWARASKNVIVDFAPEVALGLALDDELQEIETQPYTETAVAEEDIPWPETVTPEEEADTLAELAALEQAEVETEP